MRPKTRVLNVHNRFLRSAHLERDYDHPDALAGYILTDHALSCLKRMANGLQSEPSQRAWRITGDFGTGKSSFALFFAHWIAGHEKALPRTARETASYQKLRVAKPRFVPVLVTGSRQKLAHAIAVSLLRTLTQLFPSRLKLSDEIRAFLAAPNTLTDDIVLDLLARTNAHVIADKHNSGIVLIIDELGKFLEYAAAYPVEEDLYLLQRLAERAARSGDKPLFVVCLLHQGFGAYADQLTHTAQREWEKVAGRFDEILFNQPLEQIAELVTYTLNVREQSISPDSKQRLRVSMEQTLGLGWYGHVTRRKTLSSDAWRLYPLHPTVLPVLVRLFQRFGQNERSLFSFLLSNEPFGLLPFAEQARRTFRLFDLYDYVRTNFGHRLSQQSYRTHWAEIESLIESFGTDDATQLEVLKTVGILNLIDAKDLLATEDAIIAALTEGNKLNGNVAIQGAIDALRNSKRVLYNRGLAGGYCLWPHTSVDLQKAFDDATAAVSTSAELLTFLKDNLESRPLVARRHYIEKGNLRYFEVRYCSFQELKVQLNTPSNVADGTIVIPLCETQSDRATAEEIILGEERLKSDPNTLVGLPQPLSGLSGLIRLYRSWEWVSTNVPDLNSDRYAREEVSRQLESARLQLQKRIRDYVGLDQLGRVMSMKWFSAGKEQEIKNGRELLLLLSKIFDDTFPSSPCIANELVNRRVLSSAGAAARMRLIERMFKSHGEPRLGMTDPEKRPPEMSMYLSVLAKSQLHRAIDDSWQIALPRDKDSDPCHVRPLFGQMAKLLKSAPDERMSVGVIFENLRKPPYGVRDGLLPVFFAAFCISEYHRLAFYEDGSFLRQLDGIDFQRLIKGPEHFEVQFCTIEGVRAQLFDELLSVLTLSNETKHKTPKLLDVVRTLCTFVAQLPTFAQQTASLSSRAVAVRRAILVARDPVALVFRELPEACDLKEFQPDSQNWSQTEDYVRRLRKALDELKVAYEELRERIRKRVEITLGLRDGLAKDRSSLIAASRTVGSIVAEPRLKAFCLRLSDDQLGDHEWLESLGSFIVSKPPSKWSDSDEKIFSTEIELLSEHYKRVQEMVFATATMRLNDKAVRLAVTQLDGQERQRVLRISAEDESKLLTLRADIQALIEVHKDLGIVAASQVLWNALSPIEES